jgi:phospholipid/cholesterol/gamma-HCH transport system permease protein
VKTRNAGKGGVSLQNTLFTSVIINETGRGMTAALEYIGTSCMNMAKSVYDTLFFAITVILKMFSRTSYNSAVKMVLINQIYFTSLQILPLFIGISVIFGSLVISIVFQIVKSLGLADYLGRILMGLVVTELSPFITVLLIALRSSSAINTEMAVMKVNRELRTLEVFNIDVIDYLVLPRIINGILSVVLLSSLFSILALTSGLVFSKLIFGMGVEMYTNVLLKSANFYDIVISLVKCCTFGFFITLIPIRFGMQASYELTSIPVAVLNGMVKVFIAIVLIEVLSLILTSI